MNNHMEDMHYCWSFNPVIRVFRIIGLTIGGIVMAVVFAFLFGYVVQHLWNWLMPALFGLAAITYWQAFGLVLLCKILFGGFPPGHPHHGPWAHKKHWEGWHEDMKDWGDNWKDDMWKPKGSYRNWRYYNKYWKDEGKAAFESYIDKLEKEKKE
ncbi:MAG: hypothetical protein PHF84_01230 [bacterium]|nr:hypothetical protein [bacterium]